MNLRDKTLTVEFEGDDAIITVTYTVTLQAHDMELTGGFTEIVDLSRPPRVMQKQGALPLLSAVKPRPNEPAWELYRKHVFRADRYPAGPYTRVTFRAHIIIRPGVTRHVEEVSPDGVLPARYPVAGAISDLVQVVLRPLRYLINR